MNAAGLTLGWLSLAAVAVAAESAPARSSLAGRKPNIVLILTDDQGYGDVGRHGNPVIKTPHLDRLHDESVRLRDHHVSPTCAPTRCSTMTGRHEFRSGVTHTIWERERMSLKATTIAQVLKSAGYTTGVFGKWHLGDEDAYRPYRRGFDESFIHGAGGIGQTYAGTCGDAPGNKYFDPVVLHNGTFVKTSGYCTDVFFGQAAQWIESVRGRQPFFAYITPNAPHGPLICPEKYEALYKDQVKPDVAKFFGMITNIDDNVGRLLTRLKEWNLERNTLVVFMNDNGGTAGVRVWNAGMRGTKGTPYNGGTRTCGFFRWPGTLAPRDVDQLTAHLDLFPTFAALAGASIPEGAKLEGYNLLPLLENPAVPWPDRFLVTHVGRWPNGKASEGKYAHVSIRRGVYNIVSQSGPKWELYDLKADPGEKQDLAAERPEVVKGLADVYEQWWAETLPCLENENSWQTAPQVNAFKEQYWKQYGGPGPNNAPPQAGTNSERPGKPPAEKPRKPAGKKTKK